MKKITVPTLALLTTTPISVGLSTVLMSSCSNGHNDEVVPETKQLKANENNVAWVTVEFPEQPKGDEAMVNVTSNCDVELEIIDGQNSYEGIQTVQVKDKKAMVIIGVVEKQTKSINVDFDLTLTYINSKNKAKQTVIPNMKLQVDVDPTQLTDEVHILDINDFHGCVPGYGSLLYKAGVEEAGALRLARDTKKIIDQYPGSIFLSAGDNNSGNVFSTAKHGETLYPMLKAMDIQYSAVGNHAFEWGLDPLAAGQFDKWARTDTTSGNYFIAANILNSPIYKDKVWCFNHDIEEYQQDYKIWKNQLVGWADPYKILNLKGHRVCLIGLTTQKTEEDGNTDVTRYLSFIDYIAAVNYAKDYCKERIGEADFSRIESFILLTHVESEFDETGAHGAAIDLAKYINTDIDAIISAHSHKEGAVQVENEGDLHGKKIWVGQALKHGMRYLDTKLTFDNTKPTGQKLTNISMNVAKPSIDYGGHDPKSKDPQEVAKAKEAATKEYNNLIENPQGPYMTNVVNCYKEQAYLLEEELQRQYCPSAEYGAYYPIEGKNLGHEYIDFPHTVEQAGAWMERACLYGFADLIIKKRGHNVPKPWIAFNNQDSITHQWAAGDSIHKKDMFQLQTYENKTVLGYLTIGQIANIINYLLAGKTKFNYGDNNVYTGVLNTDLNGNRVSGVDLESTGTKNNTSNYLCGPLQFYGLRVQCKKRDDESAAKYDAQYEVDYETITPAEGEPYKAPKIWLYNPEISSPIGNQSNLENPQSWVPASDIMKVEINQKKPWFIPTLINDFILNGSLASNRMFKNYFEYNAAYSQEYKPQIFSEIIRDLLIDFAENYKTFTSFGEHITFDVSTDVSDALVKKID